MENVQKKLQFENTVVKNANIGTKEAFTLLLGN